MKGQKRSFRVISLILTFALVLTMLPVTAMATYTRGVDDAVFKNMQLYGVANQRPISTYFYKNSDNFFHTPVTTDNGGKNLEWTILAFSMQFSQPVDLVLYRAKTEYPWENPTLLTYNADNAEVSE